jgi:hypothetical protein
MVETDSLEEMKKKVEDELNESRELVMEAMHEEEMCRNDDKFLIWYIKRHKQDANLNNFSEFRETTSSETLRRSRAFIQNDLGLLLPTEPTVYRTRRLRAEAIREYFGAASTQYNRYKELLDPELKRDRKLMEEVPEGYKEEEEEQDSDEETDESGSESENKQDILFGEKEDDEQVSDGEEEDTPEKSGDNTDKDSESEKDDGGVFFDEGDKK